MRPYEVYQKAKELGIMPEAALAMRMRFLDQRIGICRDDRESAPGLLAVWILQDVAERNELKKLWEKERAFKENQITDEMIERAKTVPLETIIEFVRGKALAWCHDDHKPSLSLFRKNNSARCFVCDKNFDAIDCYQYAFGCDFVTAVKALQ